MEGISDGFALDSCFYCALLYPEFDSCSLCGQKMRYAHAEMLNSAELSSRVNALQTLFQSTPSQDQASALLRFLHRFGEDALEYHQRAFPGSIEQMKKLFPTPSR